MTHTQPGAREAQLRGQKQHWYMVGFQEEMTQEAEDKEVNMENKNKPFCFYDMKFKFEGKNVS